MLVSSNIFGFARPTHSAPYTSQPPWPSWKGRVQAGVAFILFYLKFIIILFYFVKWMLLFRLIFTLTVKQGILHTSFLSNIANSSFYFMRANF